MKYTETNLKGCVLLEPRVFGDERGYFFESYNQNTLASILGYSPHFLQDNESSSQFGVIRGLHMQAGTYAQAKLVRVVEGKVLDVAVDIRVGSPTFGQHVAVELSAENKKQLFVPRGFLHGFSVLSEHAVFLYKCDNNYHKEAEDGVNPLDTQLGIDWRIPREKMILSAKDLDSPSFAALTLKLT